MKYGKDTPIIIWTFYGYKQMVEKAIDLYHKINSDILFEVVELSPEEINSGLMNWAEVEDLPNIFLVHDTDLEKYFTQFNDILFPLNESADIVNQNEFLSFKIENATDQNGILYGCPFTSEQVALYINKTIFDEISLDVSQIKGQSITWDDLIDLGHKIKDVNLDCYLLPSPNYYSNIVMHFSYTHLTLPTT